MGDERVQAQASDFYGGWITADLVGPFKGPPETLGWRDPDSNRVPEREEPPAGGSYDALVAPRDIAGAGFEPATFGL